MSYVVEVKRTISAAEVARAMEGRPGFTRVSNEPLVYSFGAGELIEFVDYTGSALQVSTPSDELMEALGGLAADLGASVVGEEDEAPVGNRTGNGYQVTLLGWPAVVVVLLILLAIKW